MLKASGAHNGPAAPTLSAMAPPINPAHSPVVRQDQQVLEKVSLVAQWRGIAHLVEDVEALLAAVHHRLRCKGWGLSVIPPLSRLRGRRHAAEDKAKKIVAVGRRRRCGRRPGRRLDRHVAEYEFAAACGRGSRLCCQ